MEADIICSLRFTSGATHADLLAAGSAAGHFPTCISRGGTWLGFERVIAGFFLYLPSDVPGVDLDFGKSAGSWTYGFVG